MKYLCLLVLLLVLESCQSLQCFVCNSRFNENCEKTPPSEIYLQECSATTARPTDGNGKISQLRNPDDLEMSVHNSNYTFCRKSVTEIPRQQNKNSIREAELITIRSCGWIGSAEDVCKFGARDGTHTNMCTCLNDKCNSAGKLSQFIGKLYGIILMVGIHKLL